MAILARLLAGLAGLGGRVPQSDQLLAVQDGEAVEPPLRDHPGVTIGANMKFVLVLMISEAAGWAATDSFAKMRDLAQEEHSTPLIKTPGRQEK
jgi:hypothetical protein